MFSVRLPLLTTRSRGVTKQTELCGVMARACAVMQLAYTSSIPSSLLISLPIQIADSLNRASARFVPFVAFGYFPKGGRRFHKRAPSPSPFGPRSISEMAMLRQLTELMA